MTRVEMTAMPRPRPLSRVARSSRIRNVIVFGFVMLVWEGAVRLFEVPRILIPAPTDILAALAEGFAHSPLDSRGFWYHGAFTLLAAFIGLVVGGTIGIALGTFMSHVPTLDALLKPYILALQNVPKVAIAPLLVIYFGFGIESKVVLVALLTFFPLLVNSYTGFQSVEAERIELLRSARASSWQIFRLVSLPSSMPYIFAGLEMGIAYALTGAIVAEFVSGQTGLGVQILQNNYNLNIPGTFAVFVVLAGIGISLNGLLTWIRKRVLFWMPAQRSSRNLNVL